MDWLPEGISRFKSAWSSINDQLFLWGRQINNLPLKKKLLYGGLTAASTIGGVSVFGPVGFAIQMGMFVPFTLLQAAFLSIKDNKTFNFAVAVTAPMGGVLKMGIDAYGYAINTFTAGLRHTTFGFVSEDWLNRGKILPNRVKVGIGFWAAGVSAASATGLYFSSWHFLPAVSMTLGTIATVIPSDKDNPEKDRSHISRSLFLGANFLNGIYSIGFSQLISAVASDFVAVRNLSAAIDKFDTPYFDRAGAKVSAANRLRAVAENVFLYKPNNVNGFTKADVAAGKHLDIWRSSALDAQSRSTAYEAWIKVAGENIDLVEAYKVASISELRERFPQQT